MSDLTKMSDAEFLIHTHERRFDFGEASAMRDDFHRRLANANTMNAALLAERDILARRLAERDERIAGLEAVVAKLPKTADGVPVGPGETVYTLHGAEWSVQDQNTAAESWMDGDPAGPISDCYSTREAAEAAQRAARGEVGDE